MVFFVLPLVWLLLAPTKSATQLDGLHGEPPFSFGSFEPPRRKLEPAGRVPGRRIWTWLGNSVFYSVVALVITILVTIPAGYALAMTNFRFRRVLLITTLMVMLIPNTALVLPIFLELTAIHLVGSPLAVILPFSFFPFGVYLAYIYFSTTCRAISWTPRASMARASSGSSEHRHAPRDPRRSRSSASSASSATGTTTSCRSSCCPGRRQMPIQVGLANLISNVATFNPTNVADTAITLPQLALATLISVAPVLIVFLFSQRFLVTDLTAGATKE